MNNFAEAAVAAARLCQEQPHLDPKNAWHTAIRQTPASGETLKKSCPCKAFTGLCAAGHVVGVPSRPGEPIGDNGTYAANAVKELRKDGTLSGTELWRRVGHGGKQDSQMTVVRALWDAGLIVSE